MQNLNRIEHLYHSLKRSDNITVSTRETLNGLIELGKKEDIPVYFNDLTDKYGENYEVYIPASYQVVGDSWSDEESEGDRYRREQREAYNQSQLDQFRPKLKFDKSSFEKDKKKIEVTLDPKDLNIAKMLLLQPDIRSKNLEELLREALFSYAYRELGRDEVNDLSSDALNMYMVEE